MLLELSIKNREKVKTYSKGISLWTNFRNILWKNDKLIIFFMTFYIFQKSDIKLFKNSLLIIT